MAHIIQYEDQTNRVTYYHNSGSAPDYDNEPNILINPERSHLTKEWYHWMYEGGSLRDMTQAEIDTFFPPPPPPADWEQFMNDMTQSAEWLRIEAASPVLRVVLLYDFWDDMDSGVNKSDGVLTIWNGFINPNANILPAEVTVLNTIFSNNNIPFNVKPDGDLEAV
jgi:hypothetical protein